MTGMRSRIGVCSGGLNGCALGSANRKCTGCVTGNRSTCDGCDGRWCNGGGGLECMWCMYSLSVQPGDSDCVGDCVRVSLSVGVSDSVYLRVSKSVSTATTTIVRLSRPQIVITVGQHMSSVTVTVTVICSVIWILSM